MREVYVSLTLCESFDFISFCPFIISSEDDRVSHNIKVSQYVASDTQ